MKHFNTKRLTCQHSSEVLQDYTGKFDKKGKPKVRPWQPKKIRNLGLADSYGRIGKKLTKDYAKRGVHRRYAKIKTVEVDEETGRILNIHRQEKGIGLYDKEGKRVVDYIGRAENVKNCCTFLEFKDCVDGKMTLKTANFCKVPLCPLCQWRKALKLFYEVSRIMDEVEKLYPNYVPLFLTLTVNNCNAEELSGVLDKILRGWNDFLKDWKIRQGKESIIKGWFRALEITFEKNEFITAEMVEKSERKAYFDNLGLKIGDKNPNYKKFHPHIHAILLVDKSYFKSDGYLQTSDFVKIWRRAAKLDYDPICDIRRCKTSKGKRKEVAEVAKYTLKDSQIFDKTMSKQMTDEIIKSLSQALHGRRLYAFGGVMKEIAKELKTENPDEGDLINLSGEVREDLTVAVKKFCWDFGKANYYRY